ncbi:GGDEF domain-containing protein [Actinoplanes sp. OR16]|uniref:putative bifunctional diguanylate cyclase/phosphodiesterase n=1 Tax=Actinoplanes sp. OR16 TaxID=946334 RepID=UPI000F7048FC|nr:bifunctional diguanylate cyclase/phosphodiesterase [Actinoplanes sp. OR16]BBH69669.1 GGDEF domain-containing protein [Actinoplanes sp. OR16]
MFARRWRRSLTRSMFVPLDSADLDALLERLAARLDDDPESVGAGLVEAHLTDPEVLAATIRILDDKSVAARVALGYTNALRAATMAEQERLTKAVLAAHATAERALRTSESRMRAVFQNAAVGIGISAMDGRIVRVNQAFAELLGYTVEEMSGIRVPDLGHPTDPPHMWQLYEELIAGKRDHVRLEKAYYRRDGGEVWTDMTSSLIRDDDGAPEFTIAMVQDITDRLRLQDRLEHQAMHDPLTGLPNRTMIADRLEQIFAESGPDDRVGACFLDLDGFKRVNDTLGHQVGDELLTAVATRLLDCAEGPRRVAGRMSGDEFVLLVADPSGPAELTTLAASVLTSLSRPFQLGRHRTRISASIGVVDSRVGDTSPADLMKAADLALYVAKSEGRGRYVTYDPGRDAKQAARYELAAEMPDALDRREFTLVYQPLVALADGRLRGVEALIRWQHPVHGELSPDRFIPLAEETGLIVPLGRWVLEEACAQAALWAREFPDRQLSVSVNMTVSQVHEPTLPADVEKILARTGLDPSLLVLELTESAVMENDAEPLRALAERGIRIAIDDFGTGYSNLAYLRRLPVHILKLAGPFVDGLRTVSKVDLEIVETIVRLAHAIGLTVTAEAVETRPQADRLRDLGCDTGQGWLFARPQRPAEITELLRRSRDVTDHLLQHR